MKTLPITPINRRFCSIPGRYPQQYQDFANLKGGGWYTLLLAALLTLIQFFTPILAQAQSSQKPPTATIPALFLSDIHFDPFADPAKVAKLNAAPASDWPAIFATSSSPTQSTDSATLAAACPTHGTDTNYTLLQSSLKAIHANASEIPAPVRFVTLSGDLLAHSFDCKYKHIISFTTPSEYAVFTEKTIRYIISSLRTVLPGIPIYIALGNNDSGCADNRLDANHDPFLTAVGSVVASALPASLTKADREAVLADFATGGNYNAPLAAVPNTRILVLDNLFLSFHYATCPGKPDQAPAADQLAWLATQLASARQHHQHVWVMGHIPPGVDFYTTVRNFTDICAGDKPRMFLTSEALADILARNADIIRLAVFGHTHSDELRLLTPEPAPKPGAPGPVSETWVHGVPLKIVASISPINGNRPTFTLAKIDPATATLVDYTVIQASNLTGTDTGIATTWAPAYTYSSTYHQPAFNAAALSTLITGFQADPTAKSAVSQAYLRNFYPGGDLAPLLQFVWPEYTCSLNHDSAAAFATCTCPTPTPAQSPIRPPTQ